MLPLGLRYLPADLDALDWKHPIFTDRRDQLHSGREIPAHNHGDDGGSDHGEGPEEDGEIRDHRGFFLSNASAQTSLPRSCLLSQLMPAYRQPGRRAARTVATTRAIPNARSVPITPRVIPMPPVVRCPRTIESDATGAGRTMPVKGLGIRVDQ